MSSDLQWMIIRNTSSFMVRKRNINKPFSKDPHNLTNIHAKRYSGLINKTMVGIEPAPDNKGFVLVSRKKRNLNQPAKNLCKVVIKHHARKSLKVVRNFFKKGYRRDLKMRALRRASAIMKSQRPVLFKKKGGARKKTE